MKYTHVVFDVDGTLVDNAYGILRSLQETVAEFTGETLPFEKLTFCLGIPGMDTLRQLQLKDQDAAFARWVKLLDGYADTAKLFEGIPELLEALHRAGVTLGIVTSRKRFILEQDLPGFGIRHYFGVTVCEEDSLRHKPYGDPLLAYMERAGAKPGEVLYIGDSIYDFRCAQAAGCDFALAHWGAGKPLEGAVSCMHPMDVLRLCDG